MAQTDAANVPKPLILRDDHRTESGIEPGCFLTDWLNDPADPDLSIACIRVVPGAETRLRRFENIQERYVVLEGQGRIELVGPNRAFTEGDHTLSALEPGDVVGIPAGYSRRITNIGPVDLVFLAICTPRFRPAALPDARRRRQRLRREAVPERDIRGRPFGPLRAGATAISVPNGIPVARKRCNRCNIAGLPLKRQLVRPPGTLCKSPAAR